MISRKKQSSSSSALTLLLGWQDGHTACKKLSVDLLMVTVWLELCTSYSSSCHHHLCHPCFDKNPEWWHSGTSLTGLSWKMAVRRVSCHVYLCLFIHLFFFVSVLHLWLGGRVVRTLDLRLLILCHLYIIWICLIVLNCIVFNSTQRTTDQSK